MYFAPQTLIPGYRPGSAKIVSAIRIFSFEDHSVSRYSLTSKNFFCKLPLGGPCKCLGGPKSGWYGTGCCIHRLRSGLEQPIFVVNSVTVFHGSCVVVPDHSMFSFSPRKRYKKK